MFKQRLAIFLTAIIALGLVVISFFLWVTNNSQTQDLTVDDIRNEITDNANRAFAPDEETQNVDSNSSSSLTGDPLTDYWLGDRELKSVNIPDSDNLEINPVNPGNVNADNPFLKDINPDFYVVETLDNGNKVLLVPFEVFHLQPFYDILIQLPEETHFVEINPMGSLFFMRNDGGIDFVSHQTGKVVSLDVEGSRYWIYTKYLGNRFQLLYSDPNFVNEVVIRDDLNSEVTNLNLNPVNGRVDIDLLDFGLEFYLDRYLLGEDNYLEVADPHAD